MKKCLLFVIIILSCTRANAQLEDSALVSLLKVNYEGATDIPQWSGFSGEPDTTIEMVEDGLAITNPYMQNQIWQPQAMVTEGCLTLEENHYYIVRLTIKIPSNGIYQVNLGSWEINSVCQVPVTGGNDFQIIDVEYPEYKGNVFGTGFVMLGCGWVVGTTYLKEIEIFEKTHVTGIQKVKTTNGINDAFYNLAGQKVGAKYKGIVIQNGKKVAMK